MTPKTQIDLGTKLLLVQIGLDRIRDATRSPALHQECQWIENIVCAITHAVELERRASGREHCVLIPIACALFFVLGFGLAALWL